MGTTLEPGGNEAMSFAKGSLFQLSLSSGSYIIKSFKTYGPNGVLTEYPLKRTIRFELQSGEAFYLGHFEISPDLQIQYVPTTSQEIEERLPAFVNGVPVKRVNSQYATYQCVIADSEVNFFPKCHTF